jgi:hypothetical protein
LTLANAVLVAHSIRPECERDVRATAGDILPDVLAMNRFQAPGRAWSFHGPDFQPHCLVGLEEDRAGVLTWWMLTTRLYEKHALSVARFGRNAVRALFAAGECHRVQAFVLADWPQACKLAELIGLRREGVMRSSGLQREDIAIYAATDGRNHKDIQEEAGAGSGSG